MSLLIRPTIAGHFVLYQWLILRPVETNIHVHFRSLKTSKGKGLPQQAEVAQGDPGKLRPRIFLTFGTTRVVGRQPYAPAAFTPGETPGPHFQWLSRPQGTWLRL